MMAGGILINIKENLYEKDNIYLNVHSNNV